MMINNVNIASSHHALAPDYSTWGLGTNEQQPIQRPLLKVKNEALAVANRYLTDNHWQLCYAKEVTLNSESHTATATLLRFTRDGQLHLQGEHISAVLYADTHQLLGLTRMLKQDNTKLPSHQYALQQALLFLQSEATDLVHHINDITLPNTDNNNRMEFSPAIHIHNIELQWIDQHPENITIGSVKHVINGLKVKCYMPDTDRWSWVIVDAKGEVITFERSIHWDFANRRRLSPMWLHDNWLQQYLSK